MRKDKTVKVFGHLVPDTDTVVSAIAFAWYYNNIKNIHAKPYILGEPNKETLYVLNRFGFEVPPLLGDINEGDPVAVVDTNNIDELPKNIDKAELVEIVDHHRLTGGINTKGPVNVTLRKMASTASLIYTMANPELHEMPKNIAGILLAALVSDTLNFRSPTATEEDRSIATELATIAKVDINELADQMFKAKSDISDIEASNLIIMDSKLNKIAGKNIRISVLETTSPGQILNRKKELQKAIIEHTKTNRDCDEILLFVIDILNENATPIVATDFAKEIINKSFGVDMKGDKETVLDGVVSRKKQIFPKLKV
jgi:manganese-dependent inorganic pyrophosphatase